MPSSTPLKGLLIHVHLNRLIYCNAVMDAPMKRCLNFRTNCGGNKPYSTKYSKYIKNSNFEKEIYFRPKKKKRQIIPCSTGSMNDFSFKRLNHQLSYELPVFFWFSGIPHGHRATPKEFCWLDMSIFLSNW